MKQRHCEVKPAREEEESLQNKSTSILKQSTAGSLVYDETSFNMVSKKDVLNIIRQLFKNMIHGISHDRLVVQMQELVKNAPLKLKKLNQSSNL